MNRFKFNAFKVEFPFLENLLLDRNDQPRDPQHCDGIEIKRISEEVLKYVPTFNSWDGSMVRINKKETVSFLLADGSLIVNAVRQQGEDGSNYAHESTRRYQGESILEAIDRHKCATALKLIVVVRSGFVVRDHFSEPNYSVVIYKAAKGESLTELINEAAAAALIEVRAEANF